MSLTQEEDENDVQWMDYSTQKAISDGTIQSSNMDSSEALYHLYDDTTFDNFIIDSNTTSK